MEQLASYVAPVATTIAALIVASNLGSRITGAGFIVFTIGSIAWALLGLFVASLALAPANVLVALVLAAQGVFYGLAIAGLAALRRGREVWR